MGYERRLRRRRGHAPPSRAAIRPGVTKLVWLETPSNPIWGVSDIAEIGAHRACRRRARRRRFHLRDADLHEAARTRRRCRHAFGDQISERPFRCHRRRAVLCARRRTFCSGRRKSARATALILGPFEAFLLIRGLRTLDLSVARLRRNAAELAERFSNHPEVAEVLYPGLPHHPGHEIARRQMQRRLRRHAVDPRARRRSARDSDGRAGRTMEARDFARRRRIADRTPGVDRRRGIAVSARPAASFGGHRGRRGFVARSRSGVAGLGSYPIS